MFFEIHKNRENRTYWWEAKSEDGKTLCTSPSMRSGGDCLAATLILKNGAAGASVFDQSGDRGDPGQNRRLIV